MGTLPGNSTIDATVDPDLDAARRFNPQSASHQDIIRCVTNLHGADTVKVILGHGSEGKIITGNRDDPTKYISLWNQDNWEPQLRTIQNCNRLYFYACRTGAGEIGANFLFKVATAMNVTVLAPTGDLYVNHQTGAFTIEGDYPWQEATAARRPTIIEPPPIPHFLDIEPPTILIFKTAAGFQVVELQTVLQVSLQYLGTGSGLLMSVVPVPSMQLLPATAKKFLSFIAFDHPFSPPGHPLAIKTAEFTLRFDNGAVRNFSLLDNRLVRDETHPEVYYYCRPGFAALLG
jgi:hypothetical protein